MRSFPFLWLYFLPVYTFYQMQENSENCDIEVLTGNDSEIIEMVSGSLSPSPTLAINEIITDFFKCILIIQDLVLGVADLHTPEAVAAAESAIAGCQTVIPLAASSSEADSEDSSDNDSDDDDDDDNGNDDGNDTCLPVKLERSKSGRSNSLSEDQSKKRQKIVELS
jgi:hypothetical protein